MTQPSASPKTVTQLERLAASLDRYGPFFAALLFFLFALTCIHLSRHHPLEHDELFTYYIGQAKVFSGITAIASRIDLNPPLSYALVHASFHLFGPSPFSCRLPFMLGYALCLLTVYLFFSRTLGRIWALTAMVALIAGPTVEFAIYARPYALLLGFFSLALLGWHWAETRTHGPLGSLLLLLAGFGAFTSHVFAPLPWCVFLVAEAVQTRQRRAFRWDKILALLLPFTAILLYLPMIHNYGAATLPNIFHARLAKIVTYYGEMLARPEIQILPLAAAAVILLTRRPLFTRKRVPAALQITALCLFILLPAAWDALHVAEAHGGQLPSVFQPLFLVLALLTPALFLALAAALTSALSSSSPNPALAAALLLPFAAIPYLDAHSSPLNPHGTLLALTAALLLSGTCALVILRRTPSRPILRRWPWLPGDTLNLLGLFAVPIALVLYLIHAHAAFFPRYAIVGDLAAILLFCTALFWVSGADRRVALVAICLLALTAQSVAGALRDAAHPAFWRPQPTTAPPCNACLAATRLYPDEPFVIANGLTFLQADFYEPTFFLKNTWFLTDSDAAVQIGHASIFNQMKLESTLFPFRANVTSYSNFLHQHPRFIVFGTPGVEEQWLIEKLTEDGADIRLIGHFPHPYADETLYQVNTAGMRIPPPTPTNQ